MAVTYIGDLSTNLDIIRTRLGDIGNGIGILPGGANFDDATILAALAHEGSVGAAMAWLVRVAIARWSTIADSRTVGSRSETNRQVERLSAMLVDIEREYAIADTGAFCIDGGRDDAYHANNPYSSDSGTEYGGRTIYVKV